MAAISITATQVSALPGAVTMRVKANAAVTNIVGMAVVINSSGKAVPADADALATAHVRGVVTAVGSFGKVTCIADEMLEVVTHGPVKLGESAILTPGAVVYNSVTAGAIDETASATSGDYPSIVGFNLSDRVLYVQPQTALPVVVS